jgi:hypothetical protein
MRDSRVLQQWSSLTWRSALQSFVKPRPLVGHLEDLPVMLEDAGHQNYHSLLNAGRRRAIASQSPFVNVKSAEPLISERNPTSVEGTLPLPKQEEQAPIAKQYRGVRRHYLRTSRRLTPEIRKV